MAGGFLWWWIHGEDGGGFMAKMVVA